MREKYLQPPSKNVVPFEKPVVIGEKTKTKTKLHKSVLYGL